MRRGGRSGAFQARSSRWASSLAGVIVGALVVGVVLPQLVDPSDDTTVVGRGSAAEGSPGPTVAGTGASSDQDATSVASDPGLGGTGTGPSGEGRSGATQSPLSQSGATPSADDVGVTATTIRLGVLLLDLGGASALGFGAPGIDIESQRESWQAVADETNERGGVHGRRIEVAYETFDPTQPDTLRAACLSLTEDAKVFAVLEGTGGANLPSAIECYTVEHKAPYLTYNHEYSPELMRHSAGYLYGLKQSAVRAMANAVGEFTDRLANKKVGIVETAGQGRPEAVDRGLVDPLRPIGATVAHRSSFSEDLAAGSSQVPVEVQQMRTSGAEVVFLVSNGLHATQFVQAADAQGYRPQWIATDIFGGASDFVAMNMPPSFEGALGISSEVPNKARAPRPETSAEAACRGVYERQTGRKPDTRTSNQYGILMRVCANVDLFTNAALVVGPTLTRRALGPAIENRTTRFDVPLAGAAAFRPGKPDGGDFIMSLTWKFDCQCWVQTKDFHAGRFG